MILYLAIALVLLTLAFLPRLEVVEVRYQWLIAACVTLFAYALSFLRWDTGTDWAGYSAMFDHLTSFEAAREQSWWGPGYSTIAVLVNGFKGGYTVFLFCIATILFATKFQLLRETCAAPLMAIFALFCMSFYDLYFVRQNVAVIFFWAFAYHHFNRKPLHALCAALLAVAFHLSAALPIALLLPVGRVAPRTALLCGIPLLGLLAFAALHLSVSDLLFLPGGAYLASDFIEEKASVLSTTSRAYLKILFWVFFIAAGYFSFHKRSLPGASKDWSAFCLAGASLIVGVSAVLIPLSEVFARYPAYAAPLLATVLANYRFPVVPLNVGGAAYLLVLLLLFVELGFQYQGYPDAFYPIKTLFD